ncbi:holin [Nocardia carnea]|uniref:holin n=1 Tax=Nocardia carnea TaxID=37328 RepID=UPI0024563D0D|nr:holin [Nocardia carnea]
MFTKKFWQDTAERATKTFVQAAIPIVTVSTFLDPDWGSIASGVGLAAVAAGMSVLTSIGSTLRGDSESPSLLRAIR